MEELREIITELKKLKKELALDDWDDNNLVDCATRIFNNPNYGKSRPEGYTNKTENRYSEPATDKQKYALKKLNVPFPENITKQEAFKILKERMG